MAKQLVGTIVSDKMKKTRVIEVERIKVYPKYKKRFRVHRRFKAHDEKEEYHIGDHVVIQEIRPMSREKRWTILKKV